MAMHRTVNGHTLSLNTLRDAVEISSSSHPFARARQSSASVDIAPPRWYANFQTSRTKASSCALGRLIKKTHRPRGARWPIYVEVISVAPVVENFSIRPSAHCHHLDRGARRSRRSIARSGKSHAPFKTLGRTRPRDAPVGRQDYSSGRPVTDASSRVTRSETCPVIGSLRSRSNRSIAALVSESTTPLGLI